jgi:predicted transcriptional regulator
MAKLSLKDYSWVKRGKQRREIIVQIGEKETPTEIAGKSGYSLNHTSRILNEFRKQGLIKCLNPKEKTGRLYELTEKGRLVRDKLREKTT